MTTATSRTPTALHASRPAALHVPKGSAFTTALEILTVVACLALGAGFFGSLWPSSPAAPSATEAARTCPAGTANC